MKKISLILLGLIIVVAICHSQKYNVDWYNSFGGSSSDNANTIQIDNSGNIYCVGSFRNIIYHLPDSSVQDTSNGSDDIFIRKSDTTGNLLWTKSIGGSLGDEANSISFDASNNIYITGDFFSDVDFNPGPGVDIHSADAYNTFLLKLDEDGNYIRTLTFSGKGSSYGEHVINDINDNVYIAGTFKDSIDINPGTDTLFHYAKGDHDIFFVKLDFAGNYKWAYSFGGSMHDYIKSIITDEKGNLYIAGSFSDTVDFDPGPGTYYGYAEGMTDIFIAKYDSIGNFKWAHVYSSSVYDRANTLHFDESSNLLVGGYFWGTIDFDPGPGIDLHTAHNKYDAFIQKLDTTGNVIWTKSFGGELFNDLNALSTDNQNNIYIIGQSIGLTDFDPGDGTEYIDLPIGHSNVYFQKLDADGNFKWVTIIGGYADDLGNDIIFKNNSLYLLIKYNVEIVLTPNIDTISVLGSGSDLIISKWNQCIPSTSSITDTVCSEYYSPGGKIYLNSGIYTDTILNSIGCDSIITINLTVYKATDITIDTTVCEGQGVFAEGQMQTISGTYYDTLFYQYGCDSIRTRTNLTITSFSDTLVRSGDTTLTATDSGALYQWLDCSDNYAEINNATNQTFTPDETGLYALEITKGTCVDTSNCHSITIISSKLENTFSETIKLFPNPTTGFISLLFKERQRNLSFRVLALNGLEIYKYHYSDINSIAYQMPEIQGVYILELISAEGNIARIKVIKK